MFKNTLFKEGVQSKVRNLRGKFMIIRQLGLLSTFAAAMVLSTGIASATELTSSSECRAASVYDAKAGQCVKCVTLVTDAETLKKCRACEAGTAFDMVEGR
ncbi:MAG: hypothetical protein AAFW82_11045, partial [Pseudomonadota bacterium]